MNPKIELGQILVVDDNEMNRDMLSRRLVRIGHSVDTAVDGQYALNMLEKKKYDLVLLDVMMPVISGLEVLSTLRKKYSMADLPIIMVTAKDQSEDIVEALKLGANDYVTKPVDFPVANARIQTQLSLRRLAELKDEFLGIASHDLKNPLSGIMGYAGILKSKLSAADPVDEILRNSAERIEYLSKTMHRIIIDFLDFQAMDDGQLKLDLDSTQINAIAKLVYENNLEYAQRKEIELNLELQPDLPSINADSARIQQVIENFVSNAIKFNTKKSAAVIRTRSENNSLILEVSDTGPGLKEEDTEKLFIKYARLSNKPTGGEKSSGLGLAICKKIIELHNGKIGVRNNPDKGATFFFQLPIS
jgi:two-component system, sensor histidine kinase and response regulator